ncbi:MAG: hypothetical protein ACRCYU_04515 [Nocardioides sp.]
MSRLALTAGYRIVGGRVAQTATIQRRPTCNGSRDDAERCAHLSQMPYLLR